jgi:hypothetical protein
MPPYTGVMESKKSDCLQALPRFGTFYLAYNHRQRKGLFLFRNRSRPAAFETVVFKCMPKAV